MSMQNRLGVLALGGVLVAGVAYMLYLPMYSPAAQARRQRVSRGLPPTVGDADPEAGAAGGDALPERQHLQPSASMWKNMDAVSRRSHRVRKQEDLERMWKKDEEQEAVRARALDAASKASETDDKLVAPDGRTLREVIESGQRVQAKAEAAYDNAMHDAYERAARGGPSTFSFGSEIGHDTSDGEPQA